jgi:biopolymer transport protein TolR
MSDNILISRKRKGKRQIISAINVTPLVDVMLVLLIIFMVTSPMLVAGINIDLPKTSSQALSGNDEPISITITKNNSIYINETPISIDRLNSKLEAISEAKKDIRIFIRGDRGAKYGFIVIVINQIKNAGFNKVSLVTEIE